MSIYKRVNLNLEESLDLGAIISREIRKANEFKELCGMEPVYDPEKLKKLYKKVTGIEWRA